MTIDDLLPLWNAIAWDDRFAALDVRAKARLPQFSKSVIAAAFPYKMPEEAYGGRNLARYACVADYHEVIRARLEKAIALLREQFPNDQFAAFCDDSPLPEVSLAQRAGLGARGRLNILITKTYGTWIVLGEIVSTVAPNKLPLPVRPPAPMPQAPCGACTRCIDACPMGALRKDGFDKTRCLSFILQRKAEISPEAKAAIRRVRSVFGCDICQEACPHNANAAMSALPEFAASIQPVFDEHTDLDGRSFAWRGSKILLRNLQISRP